MRDLFLQRLPANVHLILASTSSTSSLNELAELADEIMDVATPPVSAIQAPPPPQLSTR